MKNLSLEIFDFLEWLRACGYINISEDNLSDIIKLYSEQRSKNLNIPIIDNHVCKYSRTLNQSYPRLCVICGNSESIE